MESFKLDVLPSRIFDVLDELIKQIELCAWLPLSDHAFTRVERVVCHDLVDSETHLLCAEVQGFKNKRKLRQSCLNIVDILCALRTELHQTHSYTALQRAVDETASLYLHRMDIMTKFDANKKAFDELDAKFRRVDEDQLNESREIVNNWFQMYLRVCENEQRASINESYGLKWLTAQIFQHDLELSQREKALLDSIDATIVAIDWEAKASDTVISYYFNKIIELRDEADRMSDLYDKMLEEYDWKLQVVANDKKHYLQMVAKEEALFAQRQNAMDAYLEGKRRKAAEKKLRELQEASSLRLQAWWRGTMVRQYIGPFKIYKKRARQIHSEMQAARAEAKKRRKK